MVEESQQSWGLEVEAKVPQGMIGAVPDGDQLHRFLKWWEAGNGVVVAEQSLLLSVVSLAQLAEIFSGRIEFPRRAHVRETRWLEGAIWL